MSVSIPTREPKTFVGGDSVQWTKELADYLPSDGWTLNYRLIGGGLDETISDSGVAGVYSLALSPASTEGAIVETTARLTGWVVNGAGETHTIYSDLVTVLPNVRAVQDPADLLSHEERMIALIDLVLEKRIPADVNSYGKDAVMVTKMGVGELTSLRSVMNARLCRKRGRGAPQHVAVFGGRHGR